MKFITPLSMLLLWLASAVASSSEGILRRKVPHRSARSHRQGHSGVKGTRNHQQQHRELQRVAQFCTTNPTSFNTSVYVTLIGDGSSFQANDLNAVLRMLLTAFNQLDEQSCDTTYRTLNSVGVGEVYYSDSLDWERLRFDVSGVCDGCLPLELDSGTGPLFGGAELTNTVGRRELQEGQHSPTQKLAHGKIRGRNAGFDKTRELLSSKGRGKAENDVQGVSETYYTPAPTPLTAVLGIVIRPGPPISPAPIPVSTPSPTEAPTAAPIIPVSDVCGCKAVPALNRGPTPEEFGTLLNSMIAEAKGTGTLSGISRLEDIFEASVAGQSTVAASASARQVADECSVEDNKEFTTTVWVEVVTTSPTIAELPVAERLPLEVALLEAYNEMILLSCDLPFHRLVSSVKYGESRISGDKLQFRFDVIGKCVNCDPTSMRLFDDLAVDISRSSSSVLNVTGFRGPTNNLLVSEVMRVQEAMAQPVPVIRQIHTSCVCPLNINNLPLRSPTVVEFGQVLNNAVAQLTAAGFLSSIQQVVRAAEPEIDSVCPSEVSTFVSSVFADFQGRPELLEPSEIATLEDGFKNTYNQLIFNSCDEYFRNIVDVRLVPGITRRRLQFTSFEAPSNSSSVPDLRSEAPSVYIITGECRGCPLTSSGSFSLMDDAFRFRRLTEGHTMLKEIMPFPTQHYGSLEDAIQGFMTVEGDVRPPCGSTIGETQRRLQECSCAPGAEPDAPYAPSTEEFRNAYNVEITGYNQAGLVVNVFEVTHLVEFPPGFISMEFSIFYGTLERVGNWTPSDIPPLVATTETFYRTNLIPRYKELGIELRSVNLFWNSSIPREDLDLLQVVYTAELIFEDTPDVPTADEVTLVMEQLDYVHYITDFVWTLDVEESVFRRTHSVRFVGRLEMLTDMRLQFLVRSDRTDVAGPSTEDRQILAEQANRFFYDVLRNASFEVVSVHSHVDAEDVELIEMGTLTVDFDVELTFLRLQPTLPVDEITRVLQSADLEVLRQQYLGAVGIVGSGVFNDALDIVYDTP